MCCAILVPMTNEAFFVLTEGVAAAEEIDAGMKLGANHRIGPLALAGLVGLEAEPAAPITARLSPLVGSGRNSCFARPGHREIPCPQRWRHGLDVVLDQLLDMERILFQQRIEFGTIFAVREQQTAIP
jgi:hypothetical protein